MNISAGDVVLLRVLAVILAVKSIVEVAILLHSAWLSAHYRRERPR